jgi:hypothetical protein
MYEADATLTAMAMGQNPQDRTFAQFYTRSVQDAKASLEAGRPIFSDKAYVKIMVPGDKDNIVDRPVRDGDKLRWPRQWAAYEAKSEQPVEGTPLVEWPGLTRSQVEELAFFGIKTVEDLAAVSDSQAQKFMGIQKLKARAKAYLAEADKQAPFEMMREENELLKNRIAALEAQLSGETGPTKRRRKAEPDEE